MDEPDRLVVVGASAGGVDAMRAFTAALPHDLDAAVAMVLHLPPDGHSALPRILSRATPLRVAQAQDGVTLRAGAIVVAPPGRHLLVQDGRVRLSAGPRENGHRPAVNPLFRTAADHWGPSAVGVVLSGVLDDGARGAALLKRAGGRVLVQDPARAAYAGMPRAAMEATEVDGIGDPAELARLAAGMPLRAPGARTPIAKERGMHDGDGRPTPFTCPECGGVLNDAGGPPPTWPCQIGHEWSAHGLLESQDARVEEAMQVALRTLEERRDLLGRMRVDALRQGRTLGAAGLDEQRRDIEDRIGIIREAADRLAHGEGGGGGDGTGGA
jgi:two-component system chemotaxis response regulator CheB